MRRKSLYIFALATILFAGCQKNEINPDYAGNNDIVKFTPAISGTGVLTKGRPASSEFEASLIAEDGAMSIPMKCKASEGIFLNGAASQAEVATKGELINEFGPGPQPFDTDETFVVKAWDAVTSANIIPGTASSAYQTVSYIDSEWCTATSYYWREGETKTFFAYSNLPASGASIINTSIASQTLTYAVPSIASAQSDILMGCCSGDGKTGEGESAVMTGTASILFSHPLTAVMFKLGTIEGVTSFVVNSITIEDVYASGTAEMTLATAAESDPKDRFDWTATGSTTVGQTISTQPTISAPAIGEAFLLIPQTFGESSTARIAINCTIDGSTTTLYHPLTSGTWKAGYTNTYTLGIASNPELLDGMFSVSATEYVQFSRGNLFCTDKGESESSRYAFDFEANQYDFRCRNGWDYDQAMINGAPTTTPASTSGQFQWLTANSAASENDFACYGAFSELTKKGAQGLASDQLNYGLCMGAESGWYTLSESEYSYLINSRPNAAKLRKWCNVCGVNGLLLAPDIDNTLPAIPEYLKDYATKEAWKVAEETYGLVFLPATGFLCIHDDGDPGDLRGVNGVGSVGYYYSSSSNPSDDIFKYLAYYLRFSASITETGNFNRNYARSVRLVKKFDKPEVIPTFIDLDLPSGTLWADVNVGATSKTGVGSYGNFYAWGETETKATFTIDNYEFTSAFNKYNGTDHLTVLQSEDDVAASKVSGSHIPTRLQFEELLNSAYTSYFWKDDYNGVPGLLITSKSNGNSIFLPAAGLQNEDGPVLIGNNGCYWSSTLNRTPDPDMGTAFPACAIDLDFVKDNTTPPFIYQENDNSRRLAGQSVRAVKD